MYLICIFDRTAVNCWPIYLFIANLAIDIAKNDDFLLNLSGFVLSLIIVYVPAYFATIYLEKSKFDLLNNYVQKFTTTFLAKLSCLIIKNSKTKAPFLLVKRVNQ